jgi:hypothetical protein
MTFEEMQANQVKMQATQAEIQASQVAFRENLELMRQGLANTQAIADSNARAIEATANQQAHDRAIQAKIQTQLLELAQIVRQIGESSDRRLTTLEDRE